MKHQITKQLENLYDCSCDDEDDVDDFLIDDNYKNLSKTIIRIR